GAGPRAGAPGPPRRLVVDRRHNRSRPREAPRRGLRAARTSTRGEARTRPVAARIPLPVLRLDRDEARKPLRTHAVPLDPLLRELPPAGRAVQDAVIFAQERQDSSAGSQLP